MRLGLALIAALPFAVAHFIFGVYTDLLLLLALPSVLILAAGRGDFVSRRRRGALAASSGAAALGLYALVTYKRITLDNLTAHLFFQSLGDSIATAVISFAPWTLAGHFAKAGAAAVTQAWLSWRTGEYLAGYVRRHALRRREAMLSAALLVVALGLFVRSGWGAIHRLRDQRIFADLRDHSAVDVNVTGPGDDVIILQLESVNARTLFQLDGAGYRKLVEAPGLEALWRARGGTFFPIFWANSGATDKALRSILCGVSGGFDPADARECLPNVLGRAGYRTEYFYSYFDAKFYDYAAVVPQLGFQKLYFGPDLMSPDDRKFAWGFDDCQFYRRVAERMRDRARDSRPTLTYLSVSMHHAPFAESRYPAAWAHREPRTPAERFANSLLEQDHCLPEFAGLIDGIDRARTHVFVVGDHSIPQVERLDPEDRFAVPLVYLPPTGRTGPARAIATAAPPSQADLLPTILDLTHHRASPRSFAAVLRDGAAYDPRGRCTTALIGHQLALTARADQRAIYDFTDERARVWSRAGEGWVESSVDESFGEFLERNACR